ncbi:DUF3987 domain-containing protein [Pararhodobacter sp. CCB-MM2]|uniref:DUF3987 domain-containing protein n=1 Tax=Pararhodobacter sp. CCB-MM2 TaxID=1786003 RepID=UPI001F3AE575|nr:DUF3987 domain-containing protein [Pararhodobacter sp. CCB-MM2]
MRFLRTELPPPPALPLGDVLSSTWASWIRAAAEAKGAPADYVFAALLSVCGALVGNTRWPSPWQGWAEPPVLWAVTIGTPSMNKSPGLDAVLIPLKSVQDGKRAKAQAALTEWKARAEVAKLVESTWKEAVKAAVKDGAEPPKRPASANPGPEPIMPRLHVTDITVEKLAVILAAQPRGTLVARDELAGWLQSMSRYSGGGSDRPFWLEAYGGRPHSVERMGRESVYVDRLAVGVLGGTQPDRLRTLLLKADDDGLLARFFPVWPNPAPIQRPTRAYDEGLIERAIERLWALEMPTDDEGNKRPWFVPFTDEARDLLDDFRKQVRDWEGEAEGLLLSFIGKLPGLAVRMSLVLGMLDWAAGDADAEPHNVTPYHFGRAAHLVESYLLPMARRAYADAAGTKGERAGRRLVALIREQGWTRFYARDVRRIERQGLARMEDINPGIEALTEGDLIRPLEMDGNPKGGRPQRLFAVNPIVHKVQA